MCLKSAEGQLTSFWEISSTSSLQNELPKSQSGTSRLRIWTVENCGTSGIRSLEPVMSATYYESSIIGSVEIVMYIPAYHYILSFANARKRYDTGPRIHTTLGRKGPRGK